MLTNSILDLIGNAPLVQLCGEKVFAKAEFLNPGGSIKDRIALSMLQAGQRAGTLNPNSILCGTTRIGYGFIPDMLSVDGR
jgi:cysteine synthase A